MGAAKLANIAGKGATKASPAIKKGIEVLNDNREELEKAHELLEDAGAYEKAAEKVLSRLESGEGSREDAKKLEKLEEKETDERIEAIKEINEVISRDEEVAEIGERILDFIINIEKKEESEEKDVENHLEKFKQTNKSEHLKVAYKEVLDEVEALHNTAETAVEEERLLDGLIQETIGIENLEEVEEKEAEEQDKIFQEQRDYFAKVGNQALKKFEQDMEETEAQEEEQIREEENETKKLVQLEEEEVQELHQALQRIKAEAERNEEEARELLELYQQQPVELDEEHEVANKLREAVELSKLDRERIDDTLKQVESILKEEIEEAE